MCESPQSKCICDLDECMYKQCTCQDEDVNDDCWMNDMFASDDEDEYEANEAHHSYVSAHLDDADQSYIEEHWEGESDEQPKN